MIIALIGSITESFTNNLQSVEYHPVAILGYQVVVKAFRYGTYQCYHHTHGFIEDVITF